MKNKNGLIKDITEHLDQSIETLDLQTLSRIRAARYTALETRRPGLLHRALPAGGIAAAAIVLLVALNLFIGHENRSDTQPVKVVDISPVEPESNRDNKLPAIKSGSEIQPDQIELVEILSSDQELDFFEDLEFYAWFAENENITG